MKTENVTSKMVLINYLYLTSSQVALRNVTVNRETILSFTLVAMFVSSSFSYTHWRNESKNWTVIRTVAVAAIVTTSAAVARSAERCAVPWQPKMNLSLSASSCCPNHHSCCIDQHADFLCLGNVTCFQLLRFLGNARDSGLLDLGIQGLSHCRLGTARIALRSFWSLWNLVGPPVLLVP